MLALERSLLLLWRDVFPLLERLLLLLWLRTFPLDRLLLLLLRTFPLDRLLLERFDRTLLLLLLRVVDLLRTELELPRLRILEVDRERRLEFALLSICEERELDRTADRRVCTLSEDRTLLRVLFVA